MYYCLVSSNHLPLRQPPCSLFSADLLLFPSSLLSIFVLSFHFSIILLVVNCWLLVAVVVVVLCVWIGTWIYASPAAQDLVRRSAFLLDCRSRRMKTMRMKRRPRLGLKLQKEPLHVACRSDRSFSGSSFNKENELASSMFVQSSSRASCLYFIYTRRKNKRIETTGVHI